MESYHFLFEVALILLSTKLLSMFTKRFELPQVVGALMAGLLLGPAVLGIISGSSFMDQVSELGVIVLMFTAGLETDIEELKRSGKASFIIALFGVLVPLGFGYLLASFFNVDENALLQNLFIGVILTATSVSITVETLKEMGKLSTKSGNAILGAALIDDILGIVALTLITSVSDSSVKISFVLIKIVAFFVISAVVGVFLHKGFERWFSLYGWDRKRYAVLSFAFCLLFAYTAEHFFGVADITGAFFAGLVISNTKRVTYIISRFEILSYMFLSPIFFANIGLKVVLPPMTPKIITFSVLLIIIAILTKIVGCGLGAKVTGFSNKDSLCVGVGMISRGEVALIVASKGVALGLMNENYYAPIIITVVVTTVITPILLKYVYKDTPSERVESTLVEQYRVVDDFDIASQAMLDRNDQELDRKKKHHE